MKKWKDLQACDKVAYVMVIIMMLAAVLAAVGGIGALVTDGEVWMKMLYSGIVLFFGGAIGFSAME